MFLVGTAGTTHFRWHSGKKASEHVLRHDERSIVATLGSRGFMTLAIDSPVHRLVKADMRKKFELLVMKHRKDMHTQAAGPSTASSGKSDDLNPNEVEAEAATTMSGEKAEAPASSTLGMNAHAEIPESSIASSSKNIHPTAANFSTTISTGKQAEAPTCSTAASGKQAEAPTTSTTPSVMNTTQQTAASEATKSGKKKKTGKKAKKDKTAPVQNTSAPNIAMQPPTKEELEAMELKRFILQASKNAMPKERVSLSTQASMNPTPKQGPASSAQASMTTEVAMKAMSNQARMNAMTTQQPLPSTQASMNDIPTQPYVIMEPISAANAVEYVEIDKLASMSHRIRKANDQATAATPKGKITDYFTPIAGPSQASTAKSEKTSIKNENENESAASPSHDKMGALTITEPEPEVPISRWRKIAQRLEAKDEARRARKAKAEAAAAAAAANEKGKSLATDKSEHDEPKITMEAPSVKEKAIAWYLKREELGGKLPKPHDYGKWCVKAGCSDEIHKIMINAMMEIGETHFKLKALERRKEKALEMLEDESNEMDPASWNGKFSICVKCADWC